MKRNELREIIKEVITEDIFKNHIKMNIVDFRQFANNYKKFNPNSIIKNDKSKQEWYGFKKGSKDLDWKYDEDNWKLYTDENDKVIWNIFHGKKVN